MENQKEERFDTKRCPFCSVDLQLDRRQCPVCHRKIGKVDRFGRAKEPVDWKAYALCVFSWILFGVFVWLGFFRQ